MVHLNSALKSVRNKIKIMFIMTYFKINLVLFTNLNWGQMVGNIKKRLGTLWSENFPLCRALICAH